MSVIAWSTTSRVSLKDPSQFSWRDAFTKLSELATRTLLNQHIFSPRLFFAVT